MPRGVQADVKTYQMFINGEWVASRSAKTFPVYDPSTEEVIAQVPDAGSDDVNRAVAAAKTAFEQGPWATTTAQERGRILFRLADKIRQNLAALAELECRNTGKPIVEAEYDLNDVATCFEYYGGLATKVMGHVNPVPDNAISLSLKEPVGVAGQIIPWNYPLLMAAWKLAPALAAGCTCVLKPAEQTPLTALECARYFAECGLPAGVVNIVTGFGETCGAPIVQHPDVNKIAFTGSAAVGKIIVKQAADTVKRVTLELGGKSPNIFFADADFEAAIDGALFGVFINQGEVCSAGSRILVQKTIYQHFVEAMTEKAKKIKLGPPLERDTKMGPLVSKEQYDRVHSYLLWGFPPGENGQGILCPANHFLRCVEQRSHRARRNLWPCRGGNSVRRRKRCPENCQRFTLWPRRSRLDARHFQSHAYGESPARRHCLGQSHAADLRRSAVGRFQAIRLRP
jgi:betaine-aldehyde dehydrogenase